jgi:hypothetical protein
MGVVETGSEGRWANVFSRQCDRGSIRPRAVALVRIMSCIPAKSNKQKFAPAASFK